MSLPIINPLSLVYFCWREYSRLVCSYYKRPLKKRCRIHPAGGLGVSPSFKKSPKIGGYRGLIETIAAVSISEPLAFFAFLFIHYRSR